MSKDTDAAIAARTARHETRGELDVAAAQRALDEARAERKKARARLDAAVAALTVEHAAFDFAEQVEAEREEALRIAQANQEIESAHSLLDNAVSLQDELDEIDRRLEARAAASAVPGAEWSPPPGAPQPKPRLRVAASVLIDHGGEPQAFALVDVSRTGALIALEGPSVPSLRPGALLFLTLFATEDSNRQIDVTARVVRRTERGTAVDWSGDQQAAPQIARLLDELSAAADS